MRHGSGGWSTDPNAVERWRPRQVNGTRYGTVDRRSGGEDPWLSMIGLLVAAVLLSAWWLIRHPVFTTLVVSTVWLYAQHGPAAVAAHHLILSGLLLGWFLIHRSSFHRLVTRRLLTRWRAWWVYRRRWQPAMVLSGLAAVFEGAEYIPKIRRIHCEPNADHLQVVMLSGQSVEDYERSTDALAHTFGALWCRVRVDRPGRLWLDFAHRDPLTTIIPALPVPERPSLAALPLGRREDGAPWTLTLTGTPRARRRGYQRRQGIGRVVAAARARAAHRGWVGAGVGDRPQGRHGDGTGLASVHPVRLPRPHRDGRPPRRRRNPPPGASEPAPWDHETARPDSGRSARACRGRRDRRPDRVPPGS
jgi:hypothetical protein